jgi:hypothetical protein
VEDSGLGSPFIEAFVMPNLKTFLSPNLYSPTF